MILFNEEDHKGGTGKGRVAIILERDEARDIIEALEFATQSRKQKRRWRSILKQIEAAAVYGAMSESPPTPEELRAAIARMPSPRYAGEHRYYRRDQPPLTLPEEKQRATDPALVGESVLIFEAHLRSYGGRRGSWLEWQLVTERTP